VPPGHEPPHRLLPPVQGAALLSQPGVHEGREHDGRGVRLPGRLAERGPGRGLPRPLHLAEHLRALPGRARLAATRRRDHRHQPGPRGQQRRVAAVGRARHGAEGVARGPGHGLPRPGGPARAHDGPDPAALLPAQLEHRGGEEPRGGDLRPGQGARRAHRGGRRLLRGARPARRGRARRGRLPLLPLQGLRPAPGGHDHPQGDGRTARQPGALLPRDRAREAAHARRAGPRADRLGEGRGRLLRRPLPAPRRRPRSRRPGQGRSRARAAARERAGPPGQAARLHRRRGAAAPGRARGP
jgi:hypothetical protein